MIYRGLESIGSGFGPSVVTIGNFDGVHAGHRRLLQRAAAIAAEINAVPTVLTFDPHPATVVAPERAPRLLTTLEERAELMRQNGIQRVVILSFDRGFASLTPEEFVRGVLVGALQARAVLVGENFRFGGGQAGDAAVLAALGEIYGFRTEIVSGVRRRGVLVSSTVIRRLIESGQVSRAARLLERPYALEGPVVRGRGIGSRQTAPTLNLETPAEVLPAAGVYITCATDSASRRRWPSVTNVGVRPTFGSGPLTIETHLLDPLDGPNPGRLRLEFLYRLREERKFESAAALKAQIWNDAARARRFFTRLSSFRKCYSGRL